MRIEKRAATGVGCLATTGIVFFLMVVTFRAIAGGAVPENPFTTVGVVLELFFAILTTSTYASVVFGSHSRRRFRSYFLWMLAINTVGLLSDVLYWGIGLNFLPCFPQLQEAAYYICYASAFPLLIFYSTYLISYINEDPKELRNIGLSTARAAPEKALRVQCFGNFEVFFQGRPLEFSRSKSKELFAYLVFRRGAACSIKECAAVLYEDREYGSALKNQLETFKSDLMRTLRGAGCEDVILKGRNRLSVDTERFDCDYYRFLNGEPSAIGSFVGEFMTQYSWAEITTASLLGMINK